MPSIISGRSLQTWMQILLVLCCMVLSVVYFTEPARQSVGMDFTAWAKSAGHALGIGQADASLKPGWEPQYGARGLVDFGDLAFVGCDLSVRANLSELVTYWRIAARESKYQLTLRFVMPESNSATEVMRPIDSPMLVVPLPPDFYYGGQRGQIWLRVAALDTRHPIRVIDALDLPDADGWTHICN